MAVGEWKTYANYEGAGNSSQGIEIGAISFAEPYETEEGMVIVVSIDTPKMNTRIVAVDMDGSTHISSSYSSVSANKAQLSTYKFPNLRKKQIKEYQFQARPYEWVEFKNVSLEPGFKTEVEIVNSDASKKMVGEAHPNVMTRLSLVQ